MNTSTFESGSIETRLNCFIEHLKPIAEQNRKMREIRRHVFTTGPIVSIILMTLYMYFFPDSDFSLETIKKPGYIVGTLIYIISFSVAYFLVIGVPILLMMVGGFDHLGRAEYKSLRKEISIFLQQHQTSLADIGQSLTNQLHAWQKSSPLLKDSDSKEAANILVKYYSSGEFEIRNPTHREHEPSGFFEKGMKERWGARFADFLLSASARIIISVLGLALLFLVIWALQTFTTK